VPILIQKGYYSHAYLGLVLGTLTSDLAQGAGIPINVKGAYINTNPINVYQVGKYSPGLKKTAEYFPGTLGNDRLNCNVRPDILPPLKHVGGRSNNLSSKLQSPAPDSIFTIVTYITTFCLPL
jgi:hypothetical protein